MWYAAIRYYVIEQNIYISQVVFCGGRLVGWLVGDGKVYSIHFNIIFGVWVEIIHSIIKVDEYSYL